jgi:hypothetical protein
VGWGAELLPSRMHTHPAAISAVASADGEGILLVIINPISF